MQAVKDFVLWFISEVPNFLWAEPFRYFIGFFFAFATIGLIKRLVSLGR